MIPRYTRPEMASIWEPQTRFKIWFEIEAHAADALAELGTIPKQAARTVWDKARNATFDVARRYRRDVLPLRKTITEETLLRYNAMQIDVFALLAESRERIAATIAAIEAQRDFWLADTNLKSAVLGGHGGSSATSTPTTAAAAAEPAGH